MVQNKPSLYLRQHKTYFYDYEVHNSKYGDNFNHNHHRMNYHHRLTYHHSILVVFFCTHFFIWSRQTNFISQSLGFIINLAFSPQPYFLQYYCLDSKHFYEFLFISSLHTYSRYVLDILNGYVYSPLLHIPHLFLFNDCSAPGYFFSNLILYLALSY